MNLRPKRCTSMRISTSRAFTATTPGLGAHDGTGIIGTFGTITGVAIGITGGDKAKFGGRTDGLSAFALECNAQG
jgi:hypothetical protein